MVAIAPPRVALQDVMQATMQLELTFKYHSSVSTRGMVLLHEALFSFTDSEAREPDKVALMLFITCRDLNITHSVVETENRASSQPLLICSRKS